MSDIIRHLSKDKAPSEAQPGETEPNVAAQLRKIQEHLGFLEKKLDMLLAQSQNQSQNRKPFQGRPFSPKPHFRQRDNFRPSFGNRNTEHPRHDANRAPHQPSQGGWRNENRGPQDSRPHDRPFKKRRHPK